MKKNKIAVAVAVAVDPEVSVLTKTVNKKKWDYTITAEVREQMQLAFDTTATIIEAEKAMRKACDSIVSGIGAKNLKEMGIAFVCKKLFGDGFSQGGKDKDKRTDIEQRCRLFYNTLRNALNAKLPAPKNGTGRTANKAVTVEALFEAMTPAQRKKELNKLVKKYGA